MVEVCKAVSNDTVVVPANYNSPGQVVIGGHANRLKQVFEKSFGVWTRALVDPKGKPHPHRYGG